MALLGLYALPLERRGLAKPDEIDLARGTEGSRCLGFHQWPAWTSTRSLHAHKRTGALERRGATAVGFNARRKDRCCKVCPTKRTTQPQGVLQGAPIGAEVAGSHGPIMDRPLPLGEG